MLMLLAGAVFALPAFAQSPEEWEALEKDVNFYLANDLGRNGYYDQKTIAETMGVMAETLSVECVLAAGDVQPRQKAKAKVPNILLFISLSAIWVSYFLLFVSAKIMPKSRVSAPNV